MLMDPSSNHLIVQQISEKIKKFGYTKVNEIILPSILNAILISFLIILVGNYFIFPIIISIINTEFNNNEISLIVKFVILFCPIRVSEENELTGLDQSSHGERAYDMAS